MTDLFIAGNASKITDLHQDQVEVDSGDSEEEEGTAALDSVDGMTDHARCLMQNAQTVETIVRYHSSQKMTDLFIAGNASKITNNNHSSNDDE